MRTQRADARMGVSVHACRARRRWHRAGRHRLVGDVRSPRGDDGDHRRRRVHRRLRLRRPGQRHRLPAPDGATYRNVTTRSAGSLRRSSPAGRRRPGPTTGGAGSSRSPTPTATCGDAGRRPRPHGHVDGARRGDHHFTYHPNGEVATVITPDGRAWRTELDRNGRPVARIDPLGGRAVIEYTPGGRVRSRTSPAGRTERFEYDAAGRLEAMIGDDGVRRAVERDRRGHHLAAPVTDDDGTGSSTGGTTITASSVCRPTGPTGALFDDPPRRRRSGRRTSDPTGVSTGSRGTSAACSPPRRSGRRRDLLPLRRRGPADVTALPTAASSGSATTPTAAARRSPTRPGPYALRPRRRRHGDRTAPQATAAGGTASSTRSAARSSGWAPTARSRRGSPTTPPAGWSRRPHRDAGAYRVPVGRQRPLRAVTGLDGTRRIDRDPDGRATASIDVDVGTVTPTPTSPVDSSTATTERRGPPRDRAGRLTMAPTAPCSATTTRAAGRDRPRRQAPTAFRYRADGLLAIERGPDGTRRYRYDAAGRVTSVTRGRRDDHDRLRRPPAAAARGAPRREQPVSLDVFDRLPIERIDPVGDDMRRSRCVRRPRPPRSSTARSVTTRSPGSADVSAISGCRPSTGTVASGRGRTRRRALGPRRAVSTRPPTSSSRPTPCCRSRGATEPPRDTPTLGTTRSTGRTRAACARCPSRSSGSGRGGAGSLGQAWEAIKDDPWGTLAMVGVAAVGVGLCFVPRPSRRRHPHRRRHLRRHRPGHGDVLTDHRRHRRRHRRSARRQHPARGGWPSAPRPVPARRSSAARSTGQGFPSPQQLAPRHGPRRRGGRRPRHHPPPNHNHHPQPHTHINRHPANDAPDNDPWREHVGTRHAIRRSNGIENPGIRCNRRRVGWHDATAAVSAE